MTHEQELTLAAHLRALRRDLIALALIDPASGAELERIAADVASRRVRIEAVVDAPEGTPDEARRHFDSFRLAVARLHAQVVAEQTTSAPDTGPAGSEEQALHSALELARSIELQWDCAERLLQHSWVEATSPRAAAAYRSPPSGSRAPTSESEPPASESGASSAASPNAHASNAHASSVLPRRELPPALAERARRSRAEIDAIFERFVSSNQGLVANVVRHYRGLGLSLEDLMQDGNIGLLRALEKFDERRGKPFGSYAVWWVRESVRRALAHHGRTIRLPVHAIARRYAIGKASRQLANELGRDPSAQELSLAMGLAPESIDDVMRLSKEPLSLDAPRADDTEATLGDVIADRRSGNPNEHASTRESVDHLQALLAGLSARERRVLSLRFGLDDGEEQTLEEIGRSLDLTRERVRQIVAAALDKLNRATRARRLDL